MWLRQHCVTATGPGVSLEARRWRGRSRILLLSKASLGASGTRPITSTSYCVCFTRHTVSLPLSLSSTLSSLSHSLGPRLLGSTPRREESAKGILVSCLHLSRPPDHGPTVFLPSKYRYGQYIGIWPGHCVQSLSSDRDFRFDFLLFTGKEIARWRPCAIPAKFRIEPPT